MNSLTSKSISAAIAVLLSCFSVQQGLATVCAVPGANLEKSAGTRMVAVISCDNLNKRKLKTSTPPDNLTTNSPTYVNIPGATVSFVVSAQSCVIVTFSARAHAEGGGEMDVQPLLDGCIIGRPSDQGIDVAFTSGDSASATYDAHSFTWVFPAVSPGSHRVSLQFKSGNLGTVGIFQHTVDVSYR